MWVKFGIGSVVVGATLFCGTTRVIAAEAADIESLRAKIADQDRRIEAQAHEIESLKQQQIQSDPQRIRDVERVSAEVLRDAEQRATLANTDLAAGWNNGFFLRSDDNKFSLQLLGQLQFRYVYSHSEDAQDGSVTPSADLDNERDGFEVSRTRVGFKGHVIDPTWQYYFWTGFRTDGSGFLLDAYLRKDLGKGLSVTVGQYKVPLWYEYLASETRQQFVERSLVAGALSGTYTQGVMLTYQADRYRISASLGDGLGTVNTAWDRETVDGLAGTARVEFMPIGDDWARYLDFESFPGDKPMLVIGAAAHWQQGEYGTSGLTLGNGDEAQITRWSVDANGKFGGGNVFAAVLGNHIRQADSVPNLDQYGAILQGGVFVARDVELIARYEWGTLDVSGVNDLSIATVGLSKFWAAHKLKWTTDVGYAFNGLNRVAVGGTVFGWPIEGQGWRPDARDEDGQIVVRTQVQLLW